MTKPVALSLILVSNLCFVVCFLQLFERTPVERLGYKEGTNPNIRDHKFFERINWTNLEERKVTPPFKPSVVSGRPDLRSNYPSKWYFETFLFVPSLIHSFNSCLSRTCWLEAFVQRGQCLCRCVKRLGTFLSRYLQNNAKWPNTTCFGEQKPRRWISRVSIWTWTLSLHSYSAQCGWSAHWNMNVFCVVVAFKNSQFADD